MPPNLGVARPTASGGVEMSELRKKSDPKDFEQPSTTTVFSRASDTDLDPTKNPTEDHQQSVTTGERKLSSTCRGTKVCLNLRYETDHSSANHSVLNDVEQYRRNDWYSYLVWSLKVTFWVVETFFD